MPKLYIYLGISIYFYSNDHLPIHVHGEYNEFASKALVYLKNDGSFEIVIEDIAGFDPLPTAQYKDFRKLVSEKVEEIVDAWKAYHDTGKRNPTQIITRKL
jgi:uncharacterized protein YbaA (DUF1428 family)